jgi:hypothetical protein
MALSSTQPLTGLSTRDILLGVNAVLLRVLIIYNFWEPRPPRTLRVCLYLHDLENLKFSVFCVVFIKLGNFCINIGEIIFFWLHC